MNRSIRAISACCFSICLPSWMSRAAASRRQACHVPGKKRARPASSSSTEVPTASRNQRSWATRMTAASSPVRYSSSHSSEAMSRWLVGSSSSSRSGSPASARASEARVSSPPEKVDSFRSSCSSEKPRPCSGPSAPVAPVPAAGVLEPALGARVAVEQRAVVRAARPSRPRRGAAPPRARRGSCTPTGRSRAASGRARAAGAGRAAPPACPSRRRARRRRSPVSPDTIRRSVVLPAPLRPASVMRSPRSSLNETPRNSGRACHVLVRESLRSRRPYSRIKAKGQGSRKIRARIGAVPDVIARATMHAAAHEEAHGSTPRRGRRLCPRRPRGCLGRQARQVRREDQQRPQGHVQPQGQAGGRSS